MIRPPPSPPSRPRPRPRRALRRALDLAPFAALAALAVAPPLGCSGGPPAGEAARPPANAPRAVVTFDASLAPGPIDGRVLLFLSKDESREPRFQFVDGVATQQGFGLDVEGWAPGAEARFGGDELGYPVKRWA
ncbi:MAG TPA: hypothetical protein VFS00_07300, partial [Polyangiaceae bacterium]|nr:hypothetical protein [Polyangiaceae bacterium]